MSNIPQETSSSASAEPSGLRFPWPDALPLLVCTAYGVLLSIFAASGLVAIGGWPLLAGLADHDHLGVDAVLGAYSYHNHPEKLGNPLEVSGGETHYSWIQLVPGILLTRALGLGPMDVVLVWRILGGLSIPLGISLLLRRYIKRPWIASALTAFLIGDIGLRTAQPLFKQILVALKIALGKADELFQGSNPLIHLQWRIVSPALIMIDFLIFLWTLSRVVEQPSRSRVLLAGLGFGLLFFVRQAT